MLSICGKQIRINGRFIRIARLDADKFLFLEDPEALLRGLRNCGRRVDLFTFMQKLPETSPKYKFPMEWDNFAALPVTTFEDWWTQQIDGKTRNMIRKAEKKGVIVRQLSFGEDLVRGIWEVYNECPIRQGKPFAHFGKSIDEVRAAEATYLEHSVFIGAFLNEKMIGFIKLVNDETRTQAGLMNVVSMIQHRDKSPTNALIAAAVRSCAERGIRYLIYSNFAYGKKERDSLSDFKERNGFKRIDLPRYYVPVTRLGSLALCFGLHKKFTDYLPEALLARIREFRTRKNNRNLQLVVPEV